MEIILQVLQIVTPVFLIVATGAIWVLSGGDFPTEFVTKFATKLAVPALIITVLMRSELEEAAVTQLFLASFAAYAVALVIFAGVILALNLNMRTYLAPFMFGNTGNLGLPLALFAFGEQGLELAIVVFAVTSVLAFSVGIALVSGSWKLSRLLSEPIMWGTVIGGVLLYTGYKTPLWLTNFLDLLGQLAIPLVLITLGVSLASLMGKSVFRAILLSLFKIAVCALIGFGTATLFGLPDLAVAVLTLQMATPVAVTSFMLAKLYDAEPVEVATLVVTSTFLSVVTIPVLLFFLL